MIDVQKQHFKILCFEYTRVGNVALFAVFGKRLLQKVGDKYAIFNRIGYDANTYKLHFR